MSFSQCSLYLRRLPTVYPNTMSAPGAEAEGAGAGPLVEPLQGCLEVLLSTVQLHAAQHLATRRSAKVSDRELMLSAATAVPAKRPGRQVRWQVLNKAIAVDQQH